MITPISAQTTVAVLDFDARGISANEVATLTDRFRDELTKTNQYIVIERSKMEEVLKEQGFQQSGCTSDECVVEVGQLIGVKQMVGGSIGKVGNVFTLSARIIDVESGEIKNTTNFDHIGDIGQLLIIGMEKAVQQLLVGSKSNKSITLDAKSNAVISSSDSGQPGTVTDIDGNVYKTIKIGDQRWMAENLKVTHYGNGQAIAKVNATNTWSGLNIGAYCHYNNDDSNVELFGRLYNWYAVNDDRGIAPKGWHVPTDGEWMQLEKYLGMVQSETVAMGKRGYFEGGKLKEIGTQHWQSPNSRATNESKFTALPSGYRGYDGTFYYFGFGTGFWCDTGNENNDAWYRYLSHSNSNINRSIDLYKRTGYSIRCVKD
ncbi:MAG: hypothetical protein HQ510_05445 [Candidatus Marinimicrobia bacterium]|nr:hypothetical protein [Candidatus Neomarinimicrobiota bacterium]